MTTASAINDRDHEVMADALTWIDNVRAKFDVEVEEADAEPTSWGANTGTDLIIRVELVSLFLGALELSRYQAVDAMGETSVQAIEDAERERVEAEWLAGDAYALAAE